MSKDGRKWLEKAKNGRDCREWLEMDENVREWQGRGSQAQSGLVGG